MVDYDLILAKSSAIKKYLKRVAQKSHQDKGAFLKNLDSQDIVIFNIQMAIQNCIDIAAHIISEEGLGVPASNNEMIYILEENGYLNRTVAEQMVKSIGFRNIIAHEYEKIDIGRVYAIARQDINDINNFIKAIFSKIQ